jgi:hypothetical protein
MRLGQTKPTQRVDWRKAMSERLLAHSTWCTCRGCREIIEMIRVYELARGALG